MFKNYFNVALRNIRRHKMFSLITVLGLAIGISASLVIYLIVHYHFSFDKFHEGGDRIYRVVSNMKFSGEEYNISGVSAPLYKAVREEITGIEQTTGFFTTLPNVQIPVAGKQAALFRQEPNVVFTDDAYFKFFPHQWLAGSPKGALAEPFQVVLGEAKAKKYFPGAAYQAIIGRQIIYDDTVQATVSGVVRDWTQPSDFTFDQFISFATMHATGLKNIFGLESWGSINSASQLYVKLAPGTSVGQVHGQLKKLMQKYQPEENKDLRNTRGWSLQPLADLRFNGVYGTYGIPVASRSTLYALGAAALFILLLGCINFINLTTANASRRAKEIGIRKTMGGSKSQLVFQFLSETFFITLLAAILSIIFTPWILKLFSGFIPAGVHFSMVLQPQVILFLFLLTVVVALLSGSFPAYVLSGYKPALVLKNQAYMNTGKTRTAWLRKTLTVSQFVIAQVFIMATVLVSKQIHYALSKDLGFRQEAILSFSFPLDFNLLRARLPETKHKVLETELRAMPEIDLVSVGSEPPASGGMSTNVMKYVDGKKEVETDVQLKHGDTNYLKLYGLKLLAGRNVRQSDSTTEYVINETYAHILGFKDAHDAIGIKLNEIPVVGVVADFHQRSLHEPIKPLALSCAPSNSYNIHVLLKPQAPGSNAWKSAIAKMEKAYKRVYPKEVFNYQFLDEAVAQFYKSDQDLSKLLSWATALSIGISCLGLLGLVIYTTNQRTKEIGIRKILGATVAQLVALLSKDFMLLVALAFVIAVPIAWWGMQQWLQNFVYRTTINWWVFGVSGATMLLLALLVLSVRTVKAATTNPVKNLRTE